MNKETLKSLAANPLLSVEQRAQVLDKLHRIEQTEQAEKPEQAEPEQEETKLQRTDRLLGLSPESKAVLGQ